VTPERRIVEIAEEIEQEKQISIEFLLETTNYQEGDLRRKSEIEFFQILKRAQDRHEQRVREMEEQQKKYSKDG